MKTTTDDPTGEELPKKYGASAQLLRDEIHEKLDEAEPIVRSFVMDCLLHDFLYRQAFTVSGDELVDWVTSVVECVCARAKVDTERAVDDAAAEVVKSND